VPCPESKLRSPSSQSDTILIKLSGAAVRTGITATLKVTMMIIIIIVTSRNVRVYQLAKMMSFHFHTKHEIAAIMQYSAHLLLRLTGTAKITAYA
jgi:hypothetical protein